ncbi:MAG: PAS domain S-box protein [Flavisolibacter sp.]|nr:PAS domain S-box protein [Flavisolibacter sp.]
MSSATKAAALPEHFNSVLKSSEKYSLSTLKLLALLVEETSDILTAADVNYRPITWNNASEKIYGLKAEEVIGRDLREFIEIHYSNSTKEEVREIIRTKGEWRGEAYFVRPTDKKTVTVLICFKELKEDNGHLLGYLISAIDITERKEAESRLIESEQRFRDMADSSPNMIWLSDENDNTTYVNKRYLEFYGKDICYDPTGWSSLIHPDDFEKAISEYSKGRELRKQIVNVYRSRRADGVYRWVHDICVPRFLSNGKFIGYAGSVVDIEDEKQKHEQLLYQSTVLENISDIVVTTDLDLKIKTWNKIAEVYYGVAEKDAIGQRMGHLVKFNFHESSLEQTLGELIKNGIWKGEVSFVGRDDQTKHFHHTVKYLYDEAGNKTGFLSIGRDITEKKNTEEKLKKSELFYRALIADALDGMLLTDKNGTITFASPSIKNILEYEVDDVVGKNGFEFIHPEDIAWAFESFQREVKQNTEVKFITVRLRKKNGQWLWCNVRGHNLLDNAYVNSIVIYFHDDTLRKQAKDALQESEKRFRSLVKDLQTGVFLSNASGTIIMCNKALAAMLSIPEEMIVGKNVYEIMSDDMINEKNELIPVEERPLTLTLQSKQTVRDVVLGVIHPVTKERSWIMVNSNPILDEDGTIKHVVCSVMDLTERKKLEEKLIADEVSHQRQLTQATIDGQEAERIAIGKELHDNIGQQLTTIKLFLDYAKSTAGGETADMVNMALKAVGDTINDVRSISRSLVPFTLKDLGLIESIDELVDTFMRTRMLNIEFEHAGFAEAFLPENQKLSLFRIVQEQLNNIIKHAGAKNVSIKLFSKANELVLQISDDGKGFDPACLHKGIGILNIKNRAELFNGRAELFSQPGNGCWLTVSFPLYLPNSEDDRILTIG